MALTRKFLSALGIEQDKVDEIVQAHAETVDALKDKMAEYKEKAEQFDAVNSELQELKGKENPFEEQYNSLKTEFAQYKEKVQTEKTIANKKSLYKELLRDCGVSEKRLNSILKVTNMDSVELNEDGSIKDADTLKESIQEEWSDFITQTKNVGADTETPPANDGSKKFTSKEEIMKIKDSTARQKAIMENKDLFGY